MAEIAQQPSTTADSNPSNKTSRNPSVSATAPSAPSTVTTPIRTPGRRLAIVIDRLPDKSFGLTLAGERPCRIRDVAHVTATKSGAKAGFQLVAVDGEDVSNLPHETIIDIFRKCKKNTLMLAVLAFANNSEDQQAESTRKNSTAPSDQRRRSSQQQQNVSSSSIGNHDGKSASLNKQLKTISFATTTDETNTNADALTHVNNNINHVSAAKGCITDSWVSPTDAGTNSNLFPVATNEVAVVDVHRPPVISDLLDQHQQHSADQTNHIDSKEIESAAGSTKPRRTSRRHVDEVTKTADTSQSTVRSTSRHQPATVPFSSSEPTARASPNTAARISSRHHHQSSNNKLHSRTDTVGGLSSAAASRKSFLTQLYVKSNRALYELLVIQATQNQPHLTEHYRLHEPPQRFAAATSTNEAKINNVELVDQADNQQPADNFLNLKPIKRRLSAPGSLQRFSAETSSSATVLRAKRSKRHRNQTRDLQKFLLEDKEDKRAAAESNAKSSKLVHQYSDAELLDLHSKPPRRQSRQQQSQTLTAMQQHDGAAYTATTAQHTASTSSSSALRVRRKKDDKNSSKFVAAEIPLESGALADPRSSRIASSPPAVQLASTEETELQIAVGTRQPRDRRVTHYSQYECHSERRHLCEFELNAVATSAPQTTMHHATEYSEAQFGGGATNTLPRTTTAVVNPAQQHGSPIIPAGATAIPQTFPTARRAKPTSASVRIPRVRRTAAPYGSSGGGGRQTSSSAASNRASTAEWHAYQQPVSSPLYPSYHQDEQTNSTFRDITAPLAFDALQRPLISDANPLDVMIKYYDSIHDPLGGSQEPVFREHVAFLKKLSQPHSTISTAQPSTAAPVSSSSSTATTFSSSLTAATSATPHHHAPVRNSDKQMAVVAISSGHKPFSWTRLVITQNRLILRNCRGVLASYAPKHIFQTFLDDSPKVTDRLAKVSNSSQDFTSLPPSDASLVTTGATSSAPQFFGFSTVRSYHTKKNDSDSPLRFELYSCHVLQVEPALHNPDSVTIDIQPSAAVDAVLSDQLKQEREKIVKKVCSVEEWSKMVHSDSAFPATPVDIVDAINHLRRMGSIERRESRDKTMRLQQQQSEQQQSRASTSASGSTKRHRQASSSSSATARAQQQQREQEHGQQLRPKPAHTPRQATSLSLQAPRTEAASGELSVRRHSTSTPRERRRRTDVKSSSSCSSTSSSSSCSICSRSSRTSSDERGENSEDSLGQPSPATAAHSNRSGRHLSSAKSRPKSSSTRRRTRHNRGTTSAADMYGYEPPLAVENELLVEQQQLQQPHEVDVDKTTMSSDRRVSSHHETAARPQRPSSLRFVQQKHHHHRHSHRDHNRPKHSTTAEPSPGVAQTSRHESKTSADRQVSAPHQRRHNSSNTVCFANEVEVLAFEECALNVPSVNEMVAPQDIARLAQGKIVRKHRIKLPSGVMKEINVDNKENLWPVTTSAAPPPNHPLLEEDTLKGNGKEPASRTTSSNNRPMPPTSTTAEQAQVGTEPLATTTTTIVSTTTTTTTAVSFATAAQQELAPPAAAATTSGILKSPAGSRSSSSPRPPSSRRKASEPVGGILRNRRIDEISRLDEKRHSQAAIPAIPPEWAHMDIASMHIGSPQRGMSFGSTTSSMGGGLPLVVVGGVPILPGGSSGEANSSTLQSGGAGAGVVGGWRLSEPHAAHPGHPHPGGIRADPSKPPDNIDEVLEDPLGVMAFREFLSHEYSEENLLFWLSCEQLKNQFNDDPILCGPINKEDLRNTAREIYERFLNPTSEQAVNVDARARALAQRLLDDPDPTIFNVPQEQIYKLMKFDSFPRFRKSDRCQAYQTKWLDNQKQIASGSGDKGAHGHAGGGAATDKKAGIVSGLFSRFAGKRTQSLRDKRGRTLPGGAGTELLTTHPGPGPGGGASTALSKTPPSGAADASVSRMQSIKQRLFKSGRKSAGRSPSPGATTPRATTPGPGVGGSGGGGNTTGGGSGRREPSKQVSAANLLTIQPDMPSEERRRHSMVSMQYLSGQPQQQQKQTEPGKATLKTSK